MVHILRQDDPPAVFERIKKKEITSLLIFQSRFAELRDKYCDHNPIYTDGSKVLDMVAAAAISDHHQSKILLLILFNVQMRKLLPPFQFQKCHLGSLLNQKLIFR